VEALEVQAYPVGVTLQALGKFVCGDWTAELAEELEELSAGWLRKRVPRRSRKVHLEILHS
jgi:hypothetical protein